MKLMRKFMCLVISVLIAVSFTACGGNKNRGPQGGESELAVYGLKQGLGVQWLTTALDLFKQEEWVKEKYPNLTVYFQYNEQDGYSADLFKGGKGSNPYDIIYGSYLSQFVSTGDLLELTDVVYNTTVPGEDVLIKDKINKSALDIKAYLKPNGEISYNSVLPLTSARGLIYNAEKLAEMGYELPVTTDEFLEVLTAITAIDGYAILSSREGNAYWDYLFRPLLVQYMGEEGYRNFFDGVDQYGRRSNKIFEEKGRLRVLEFLEELYKFSNGFISKNSDDLDFMGAQLGFLQGNGVFMPNGSWFENEMAELKQDAKNAGEKIYDIRFMKLPILSSILEVLPDKTITTDAQLRSVVRAIDNGETSFEGVSEDDYLYVASARSTVEILDQYDVVIPSYTDSKELAIDFIRFLSTDKVIEGCYQSGGATSTFTYDIKANTQLYNSLSKFDQSCADLLYGNAVVNREIIVPNVITRMSQYGGINLLSVSTTTIYGAMSSKENAKSAQTFYNDTLNYWTTAKFNEALQKAGY